MSPLVTAGSGPATFIKVPQWAILDHSLSDAALLTYTALSNHPGNQAGWIRKPHAHLARYLGWDDVTVRTESATKRVARALKQLLASNLIQVRWIREGQHKVPIYRVLPRPSDETFEALPRDIFNAARSTGMSRDGATMVRHWLLWRTNAGAAGWARPDCKALARSARLTAKAVTARLQQLLAAGWVRLVTGIGGDALRFAPASPASARTASQVPVEAGAGGERSVHQPTAQQLDEVSTPAVTKCPAGSSHPSSNTPSDDPSVGAAATTAQSVEREATTAGKPPRSKIRRRHDQHHDTARRIINAQPHLAGNHFARVRHRATNLLAKRLRTAASQGSQFDPAQVMAYIADRLEQAAQDNTLGTNHCQLIRQALANLRADTLAAPTTSTPVAAAPGATPSPEHVDVADGPRLEDLAALPAPSRRQAAADPAVAVDAVAADLARWLLDQLEDHPDSDVDELLRHAQHRLERTLVGTPFQVAIHFAPGMVRRAYQRSVRQVEIDEHIDVEELRRVHDMAVASLAMAKAA